MAQPEDSREGIDRRVTRRLTVMGSLAVVFGASASRASDGALGTAVRPEQVPLLKRSQSGLYVTAQEAYAAHQRDPSIVLIDVRTHGETVFSGVAVPMHRHIPYLLVDSDHGYDAERRRYKLTPNPDFAKAIEQLYADYKLARTATVILYCSTGERSGRAAGYLAQIGYSGVHAVVDGFEGEPAGGDTLGKGWKPSGLPWTTDLSPSQIYKSPSM